jgi:hypothetical protein
MRFLFYLALLFANALRGDVIDDAAHALGLRIADRIEADERMRLIVRNISSLPKVDAARARRAIEAAMPKHSRAKRLADVTVTFSENAGGYVWVAEIHKEEVEIVSLPFPKATAVMALPSLTKRLIWQQDKPILDFVRQGEQELIVLSSDEIALIKSEQKFETPIEALPVRDPRGRLDTDGNSVMAYLPGSTCLGTLEPLHVSCTNTVGDFLLNGEKVHFVAGRNTIDGIRPSDENVAVCGGMKLAVLKEGTISLLGKSDTNVDQVELPGPITALWADGTGGRAVVHDPNSGQYAAYTLSMDCGSH